MPEERALLRAAVGYGRVNDQLHRRLPRKLDPLSGDPEESGKTSGELREGGVDVVRIRRPIEVEEKPAGGEESHPRIRRRKRLDGLKVYDRRAKTRQNGELGGVVVGQCALRHNRAHQYARRRRLSFGLCGRSFGLSGHDSRCRGDREARSGGGQRVDVIFARRVRRRSGRDWSARGVNVHWSLLRGVGPGRAAGKITLCRHAACKVCALGRWWKGKVGRRQGRRWAGEFSTGLDRSQFPRLSCSIPRQPRRLQYLG